MIKQLLTSMIMFFAMAAPAAPRLVDIHAALLEQVGLQALAEK